VTSQPPSCQVLTQQGLSSTTLFSRAFKCRACTPSAGARLGVLHLPALSLDVKLLFDNLQLMDTVQLVFGSSVRQRFYARVV
jgi:hypothetical protein